MVKAVIKNSGGADGAIEQTLNRSNRTPGRRLSAGG